ncbi:hypothetical protein PMAYCL1PPCAC_33402, partial [Pristionchus mayeri]
QHQICSELLSLPPDPFYLYWLLVGVGFAVIISAVLGLFSFEVSLIAAVAVYSSIMIMEAKRKKRRENREHTSAQLTNLFSSGASITTLSIEKASKESVEMLTNSLGSVKIDHLVCYGGHVCIWKAELIKYLFNKCWLKRVTTERCATCREAGLEWDMKAMQLQVIY